MEEVFGIPVKLIHEFRTRMDEQDVAFVLESYRDIVRENVRLSKENKLLDQQIKALTEEA